MRAKVTGQGVLVPRQMLGDAEEVEIRQADGLVIVAPLPAEDPISSLGKHPVSCDAPDASEAHDRYLYGPAE